MIQYDWAEIISKIKIKQQHKTQQHNNTTTSQQDFMTTRLQDYKTTRLQDYKTKD